MARRATEQRGLPNVRYAHTAFAIRPRRRYAAAVAGKAVNHGRSHFVKSLDRGLAVICAFSSENPELAVSDVADLTGISRAASRRFLLTLVDLGYLTTNGRTFSLTPRVLELGYAYLSAISLSELARPYMAELAGQLNEGVSISILDGIETVNVGRVEARGLVRITVPIGTRLPAHCNSMGRVLLAALAPEQLNKYFADATFEARTSRTVTDPAALRRILAKVHESGYALVDQELENGLVALAVPLHNVGNRVAAAMNVSTHSSRFDLPEIRRRYLPPLQAAARRIEEALRFAVPLH